MLRLLLAVCCATVLVPAQQFLFDTDPSPSTSITANASAPVAGARGWFRANDASFSPGLYVTNGSDAGTSRVLA